MISYPIAIDGRSFPGLHVTSLKRNFQVLDTDLTERVQTGDINRDVIGTYYNYSVEIDADDAAPDAYDAFYEIISSPDESHTLQIPYAQRTLTFRAYVTNGSDELLYMMPSQNRWGSLSFNFIACSPQRRPL